MQSFLRNVRSIFKASSPEGSIQSFLFQIPLFSFPQGHPVAAYNFFLVFSSLLAFFYLSFNNVLWNAFLRKVWLIQLAFLRLTICRIFVSSLTMDVRLLHSFLYDRSKWPFYTCPGLHFKPFKAILIFFSKIWIYSNIITYVPNAECN